MAIPLIIIGVVALIAALFEWGRRQTPTPPPRSQAELEEIERRRTAGLSTSVSLGTITAGNIIRTDGEQQAINDYIESQKIPASAVAALGAMVGGTMHQFQAQVQQDLNDILRESTKQQAEPLREYAKNAGTYRPPKHYSRYDIALGKPLKEPV